MERSQHGERVTPIHDFDMVVIAQYQPLLLGTVLNGERVERLENRMSGMYSGDRDKVPTVSRP